MFNLAKTKSHNHENLASPPGYYPNLRQVHGEVNPVGDTSLIVKKSWDISLQPIKQIPMNLFLLYMTGNSVSIIPIMMVGMLLLRTIRALMSIKSKFAIIEGDQAVLQKLAYLAGNLASLALAIYKFHSMGLLPTYTSDWLDFLMNPKRMEYNSGGFNLNSPTQEE